MKLLWQPQLSPHNMVSTAFTIYFYYTNHQNPKLSDADHYISRAILMRCPQKLHYENTTIVKRLTFNIYTSFCHECPTLVIFRNCKHVFQILILDFGISIGRYFLFIFCITLHSREREIF